MYIHCVGLVVEGSQKPLHNLCKASAPGDSISLYIHYLYGFVKKQKCLHAGGDGWELQVEARKKQAFYYFQLTEFMVVLVVIANFCDIQLLWLIANKGPWGQLHLTQKMILFHALKFCQIAIDVILTFYSQFSYQTPFNVWDCSGL